MFRSRLISRAKTQTPIHSLRVKRARASWPGRLIVQKKLLCQRLFLWHPRTGIPIDSSGRAVPMSPARNAVSQLALHRKKNDRQTILPVTLEGNGDTAAD